MMTLIDTRSIRYFHGISMCCFYYSDRHNINNIMIVVMLIIIMIMIIMITIIMIIRMIVMVIIIVTRTSWCSHECGLFQIIYYYVYVTYITMVIMIFNLVSWNWVICTCLRITRKSMQKFNQGNFTKIGKCDKLF